MYIFNLFVLLFPFISLGNPQVNAYNACEETVRKNESLVALWEEIEAQCLEGGEIERHFWGKNMNLWKITNVINSKIISSLEDAEVLNRESLKNNGCFDNCDLLSDIRTEFKVRHTRAKTCKTSFKETYKFQERLFLEEGLICDRKKRREVYKKFKNYIDPFMDPRIKSAIPNLNEYRNRCSNKEDCPFKQAFIDAANFHSSCPIDTCDADVTTLLKIDPITCRGYLDITLDCTHLATKTWMIVASVPNYDIDIYYDAKLQCLDEIWQ